MLKKMFLGLLLSGVMFQETKAFKFNFFSSNELQKTVVEQRRCIQALEKTNKELLSQVNRRDALLKAAQKSLDAEKKAHKSTSTKMKIALIAIPTVSVIAVIGSGVYFFISELV